MNEVEKLNKPQGNGVLADVMLSLPSQEEIDEQIDKYAFRVPYDGSNNFYDEVALKHYKAGIEWLLGRVRGSADLKYKFFKKVEQIAQTYHDRLCMSGLTMEGQVCKCCESVVLTTTSIEHDSQDYSKDLNVCANCYSHIATWWKNNRPRKIAPI